MKNKNISLFIVAASLVLAVSACKPKQMNQPSVPQAAASGGSDVVAVVNGTNITDAELTEAVKSKLKKLDSEIFDIKNDGLSDLIEQKLLEAEAKSRGTTVDALLESEVKSKVVNPTDGEIQVFYENVKDRLGDKPLSEVKDRIVAQLKQMKERSAYQNLMNFLQGKSQVDVKLQRPRIEVSVDDDPSKGPEDAPITIVEFTEYQCPFCKRARPTVSKILDTYKDKIHYVLRDFPLSFHNQARKACEAASCAGDQGKYWEYSDVLWENQGQQEIPQLKEYAKKVGLNVDKFNKCLDSGKFDAEIEKDINDGSNAGVSGTPAYFINGVFISGAQPFENFKKIIDEELKRLGK